VNWPSLPTDTARADVAEPGLKVTDVASLSNLVADIAAKSPRGLRAATGREDG